MVWPGFNKSYVSFACLVLMFVLLFSPKNSAILKIIYLPSCNTVKVHQETGGNFPQVGNHCSSVLSSSLSSFSTPRVNNTTYRQDINCVLVRIHKCDKGDVTHYSFFAVHACKHACPDGNVSGRQSLFMCAA